MWISCRFGSDFSTRQSQIASQNCGATSRSLLSNGGEAEATTREMMDVLGHDRIEMAELHSRSASQGRLAASAMDKVVRLVGGKG
jgi:hypothetical protein